MPMLELIPYASEFLFQARDSASESSGIEASMFTSRQSQAIAAMGITRILRKNTALSIPDLIQLSIITSPPEAHGYAEMIAMRILLGDERELFEPLNNKSKPDEVNQASQSQNPKPLVSNYQLPDLDDYQKLLEIVLSSIDLQSSIQHPYQQQIDFMEELRKHIEKSNEEKSEKDKFYSLAYEFIGGRQGIMKHNINSIESFMQQFEKTIIRETPKISAYQLAQIALADKLDTVEEYTTENRVMEQISTLKQTKDQDFQPLNHQQSYWNTLNQHRILNELQNVMQQYDYTKESVAPSFDQVKNSVEDQIRAKTTSFKQLQDHNSLFEELQSELLDHVLQQELQSQDLLSSLKEAMVTDQMLQTNFTHQMLEHVDLDEYELQDLLKSVINDIEWYETVIDKVKNQSPQNSWSEDKDLTDSLQQTLDQLPITDYKDQLKKQREEILESMIPKSKTKQHLTDVVKQIRQEGISFDTKPVKNTGKELGMTDREIAELIGDLFSVLKQMIDDSDPSFERVEKIVETANFTSKQMGKLMDTAMKSRRSGAMGALAHQDLMQATDKAKSADQKKFLEDSMGIGGGMNLLKSWFMYNHRLPAWIKPKIKQLARKIMIDLAKKKASALIGSSEAGELFEGSIRPYLDGDDPESLDIEESIENIISMGKNADTVEASDLIVRESVSGRRCVVFLVDISGSMSGKPLANAGLVCTMLLYAFARDELGVALFESNTHVICEINQEIELENVVDEILDLTARGGTMMSRAVEWAEGQFKLSQSKDKMFVMLTDAMIGDFSSSQQHLMNIANQGATSVLVVPPSMYGLSNLQNLVKSANARVVSTKNWEEFPELVSRIISRA